MFFVALDETDAPAIAGAIACVIAEAEILISAVQRQWLKVIFDRLLGYGFDLHGLEPIQPVEIAQKWPDQGKRCELIELLVSLEMLCNPIPAKLHDAVNHWASVLGIESSALMVARELTLHHQQRATRAWYRLSWFGQHAMHNQRQLQALAEHGVMAFALTFDADPQEAARWRVLQELPTGSLGKELYNLLDRNGFGFPGEPGATHPTLALHDWIHVITNLSVSPLGEIATAAFIAAASRSSEATLAFLGTISIFEASLLDYDVRLSAPDCPPEMIRFSGSLSKPGAIEAVSEAIKLGRRCPVDPLNNIDYFKLASRDLAAIRRSWLLPEEGLSLDVI